MASIVNGVESHGPRANVSALLAHDDREGMPEGRFLGLSTARSLAMSPKSLYSGVG
jgi:hypothetical protein